MGVYNTLKQQEEMRISGKSARQMVMQKLMGARGEVRGKEDSVVLLLKNMVGPDEVDEELHDEIQQECGKYGKVENVSSIRRNKMTLMTLRCMSKFLLSSTRVLRRKRPRMAWMEDFLVVEQCLL